MDLLTNAVESIQAGVEDYRNASRPRLLSAVRNIHAGILLLYKEALRRRSPAGSDEVLIKAKIEPRASSAGDLSFVGVGRKTADIQQIRDRFQSLGISTDWTRFDKISRLRNEVEHYYPKLTKDALHGLVASAFVLISRFMKDELKTEPRTLLGQDTWEVLLEASDVYDAERQVCDTALQEVRWESEALAEGARDVRCDDCGSDLLHPSDQDGDLTNVRLVCRVCGKSKDAETFVPEAVAEALGWEAYLSATDGAEEPYAECPECGTESYVFAEGRCAYCGESVSTNCARCGSTIPASELTSAPLCGYCDHVMSKDD